MKTDKTQLRKDILAFLKQNPDTSYRPKEISRHLNVKNNKDFREFMDVVEDLSRSRLIASAKGNKIGYLPPFIAEAQGKLTMHPNGFAFVTIEGFEDDIFVQTDQLGDAIDGDIVALSLMRPTVSRSSTRSKRQEGKVVSVVERTRKSAVGSFFVDEDGDKWVRPDDAKLIEDILVMQALTATDGDKVVISLDSFNDELGVMQGNILEVIGRADDPKTQILALAMSKNIRSSFPDVVEAESAAIPLEIPQSEIARRLDVRQKRVFTIDPHDAKDFDDAMHLEALPNGNYEVGVHIADVSHYIPIGGALDQEAYLRATSVYLVDRVIPMLPEKLSNGVCSLRPHEDKLTYSVIFEVTPQAEIVQYAIRETVIHSHQRFSYEEAQAILDGEDTTHAFRDDVLKSWDLAKIMRTERFQNGAVSFDHPEVKVRLNENSEPIEIYLKSTKEANWLIEEWMLLANKTVAKHIGGQKTETKPALPFVYRTHPEPNAVQMRQLADYVRMFSLHLPMQNGTVQSKDLNNLLEAVKGKAYEPLVEDAALRAMSKAKYTVENIGHYGLGFEYYSHFTSPIRRYPDLMIHRLLKKYALSPAPSEVQQLTSGLNDQCLYCSMKEKEAEEAERDSIKLKQVEYMTRHIGETFDGVVSGVTNFGVFVELSSLLVEGMIPMREMTDDFYEYDETQFALFGRRTKRIIRIGNEVKVKVVNADIHRRKLDFVFV
jgi:ribonuclease R